MKKKENTVLWWIGWIVLSIASFFVSCYFWTGWIASHVGPMTQRGASVLWVSAVFGSWMLLLVPLIIVMYAKVDKAYEDARLARENKDPDKKTARRVSVDEKKRRLSPQLASKLTGFPEAIRHGHLVHARLKDGRQIQNVFILNKKEVLGVYGRAELDFNIQEIVDLEAADLNRLPLFETEQWMRLDG